MDAGAVAVVGLVNPVVGTALGVLAPRGAVRPGAPGRGGGHPRQRARGPGAGQAPSHASAGAPGSGATAYRGVMPHVTTTDLTTPSGPVPIPTVGFGVWQVPDDQVEAAVVAALDAGYRHVDTARLYGNEAGVGRALAASDVARDDVFVTTKVWNSDHGRDATLTAFDASMGRLGLDVLDLFLIHWPAPGRDRYVETWQALRELRDDGRVRAIGVCNFHAAAPAAALRRDGGVAEHQPGRAAPLPAAGAAARVRRRARHRHRVLEPARLGQAGARRPGHRADRTAARGHPGAGRHRVAPRAGARGAAEVGHAVADRREPRRHRRSP